MIIFMHQNCRWCIQLAKLKLFPSSYDVHVVLKIRHTLWWFFARSSAKQRPGLAGALWVWSTDHFGTPVLSSRCIGSYRLIAHHPHANRLPKLGQVQPAIQWPIFVVLWSASAGRCIIVSDRSAVRWVCLPEHSHSAAFMSASNVQCILCSRCCTDLRGPWSRMLVDNRTVLTHSCILGLWYSPPPSASPTHFTTT